MEYGDIAPLIKDAINYLKAVERNTGGDCCIATTSAGSGSSIPAGFTSIAIVQTGAGTVDIQMSDGSNYSMTAVGEVFSDSINAGSLPTYIISGSGTWKWHGIK